MFDSLQPDAQKRLGDYQVAPGLFFRNINGQDNPVLTNVEPRERAKRGAALINTATGLLGLLGIGLFVVSVRAQYTLIFAAKHARAVSWIEALALDVGMSIFSLLALGMSRAGMSAKIERVLILACALASAGMNYAAADVTSARSVAVYAMPPIFLAICVDRVVAIVRRHFLGDGEADSPWSAFGKLAAKVALYGARLIVAPVSTIRGGRIALLAAAPVPEPAAKPEPEIIDAEIVQQELPSASERGALPLPLPQLGPVESFVQRPNAGTSKPKRKTARRPKSFASGKTARFLAACAEKHGEGQLAGIDLSTVYAISKELAPQFDLHPGSARNALRKAVLTASEATQ